MLVPFASIPIIAQTYGADKLAIWLLVLQVSRLMRLLNLGLNNSLIRFLAKPAFEKNTNEISEILSTTLITLVTIGLFILLVSLTLYYNILEVDAGLKQYIVIPLVFISIGMPFQVGYGSLAATKNFALIAFFNIFAQVGWLSALLLFYVYVSVSFEIVILTYFIIFILKDISLLWFGQKKLAFPPIRLRYYSRSMLGKILSISVAALALTASATLLRQGGPLWLGMKFEVTFITQAALPLLVLFGLAPFINVLSQLIMPTAAIKNNDKDLYNLKNDIIFSARYTMIFATLLLVVSTYTADTVFSWWLGSSLPEKTVSSIVDYFLWLFYFYTLMAPSILFRSVLVSIGKHWQTTSFESICNIIGFVAGIILTVFITSSAGGVIYGVCAAFVLRAIGLNQHLIRKHFSIRSYDLFKAVYFLPILMMVSQWITTSLITNHPNLQNQIMISQVFILGYLLVLSVEQDHWNLVKRMIRKL
jgi:O-antigen/teichoic acid export membrane protein